MNVIPLKSYHKINSYKSLIYKENYKKSGIYRLTNLINNKSYIGSSINLSRRLSDYFSIDRFRKIRTKGRSLIGNAIIKHGISNFNLDILEYSESDIIIKREQYYLDLLRPKYNILKVASSTLGRKLSEEIKINMSIRNKGNKNPMYGKHHTDETKFNMSINNRGFNNPMYGKTHTEKTKLRIKMSVIKTMKSKDFIKSPILNRHHSEETRRKISESNKLYKKYNKMSLETRLKLSLRSKGLIIKVYDNSNNLQKKFSSLKETAKYFNLTVYSIRKCINNNINYRGFTFISEIKNGKIGVYNYNYKLIETLNNGMNISKIYNIPRTTVYRYIETGKLYKNKYYFSKINN
jgi:group I intron endonuclease